MTADRTLAERAREQADLLARSSLGDFHRSVVVLRALADENDTQRAELDQVAPTAIAMAHDNIALRAERDRYWNLAEQLAVGLAFMPDGVDASVAAWRDTALAAFRAEKDSRDG